MLIEIDNYDWQNAFGEDVAEIEKQRILKRHVLTYTSKDKSRIQLKNISRENVSEILYLEEGENDGATWIGIFKTKDGQFISVDSGCDYTGWDCQAGGTVTISDNLEDLIRYGVSEDARKRFGIILGDK